jgi:metacaspase-1
MRPTRKNMFDAMKWLVKDAKKHDSLFFHCNITPPLVTIMVGVHSLFITSVDSGHGGQVKDETGKESDGMDEGT